MNPSKNELPDWVKDYRDQSWQIEMLIAGSVIFSLYSASDIFREYFLAVFPISYTKPNHIILLFGVYVITRILLIGFTANLILRSVWLAYLGINFSFPKGVNYNKLKLSSNYKEKLKSSPNIVQRVVSLERWCNLSYSFAVLLALFTTSLLISVSAIIWILDTLGASVFFTSTVFIYSLVAFLAIVQLGVFDKLLFSRNRASGKLGKVLSGISRFLEIITLSFLFKRELLVMRTNANKWLLYLFSIAYIFIALVFSVNHIDRYYSYGTFRFNIWDDREQYAVNNAPRNNALRYQNNLSKSRKSYLGCIQSDIIKDRYVKLFVVSWVTYDNYLKTSYEKYGYEKDNRSFNTYAERINFERKNDSVYRLALNDLFRVSIDDKPFTNLTWSTGVNPVTLEDGYYAYIDINSLEPKEHKLKVKVAYINWKDEKLLGDVMEIPFWKD
ncbi:hypothetical protein [Spongiivirga citrea]|uniref:Uncharacterized protein n=1 Tax=Spongiivirga citrea TaxID=1481457 RepID=A0A6M0CGF5_9FLAO|nr:hypothetical protein [Spongiivirga citrea]NER16532.1 hypothetical protein [Spongiivirga citrea]